MKKLLCILMLIALTFGLVSCINGGDTVDKLCSALQNGDEIAYLSLLDLNNYSKYLYAYHSSQGELTPTDEALIDKKLENASSTKSFIMLCDDLAYVYDEGYTVTHSTVFDGESDQELLQDLKGFNFDAINDPTELDTFCKDFIKGLREIRTVQTNIIIRSTKNPESKNRTAISCILYNYNGYWYMESTSSSITTSAINVFSGVKQHMTDLGAFDEVKY